MTVHYKTQGFIFKKEDRLEADRVFSIFTKDFGRIEVLGKAIRKITSKLRGGIEIFSFSEIEFIQGKNRKTLTDASFIEKFENIYEIPEKFWVANKISNLVDDFIRGEEKDYRVSNLLRDIFIKLGNHLLPTVYYSLIYYYFFWNFISDLGYKPELLKCAVCQQKLNPFNLHFSNKNGGIICADCSAIEIPQKSRDRNSFIIEKDILSVKPDTIKILRLILEKDWDTLSRLKLESVTEDSLKEISNNYYNYLLSNYKT